MSFVRNPIGHGSKFMASLSQLYSTNLASLPVQSSDVKAKRTSVDDPTKHSDEHLGLYYTVPESVKNQLFSTGGLPKPFMANVKTFTECSIMVRSPALELIQRLKTTDFSKPAVRYVLYGRPGCGKSLTLAHVLHYALVNKFVLVHVPWSWNLFRNNLAEVTYSSKNKQVVDLPLMSALWLKHFQTQNPALDSLNLQTRKDYEWTQRERTPAGSPLSALVLHGINRVKFAADCVIALIDELKSCCNADKCKALIAVDGFNAFVQNYETQLKTEDKIRVRTGMVSFSHAFQEATKQDWKNGAVVVTVDQLAAPHQTLESHWPIYLLGRAGFEHLDPFIPISVTEYTDLELNSALDYYEDRKWLQRAEGRDDLSFLSNKNPYTLMTLCAGF